MTNSNMEWWPSLIVFIKRWKECWYTISGDQETHNTSEGCHAKRAWPSLAQGFQWKPHSFYRENFLTLFGLSWYTAYRLPPNIFSGTEPYVIIHIHWEAKCKRSVFLSMLSKTMIFFCVHVHLIWITFVGYYERFFLSVDTWRRFTGIRKVQITRPLHDQFAVNRVISSSNLWLVPKWSDLLLLMLCTACTLPCPVCLLKLPSGNPSIGQPLIITG